MTERESIIERLSGLEMEGGSHAALSAICKAVLPHGDAWTLRRCADLRDRLVRLLGEADTAPSGGRITGELRNHARLYEQHKRAHIECIADRIDAAHEKAIASVMNDALYHANDKDMADLGWVRLPKDADGEPIHMGDLVTVPWKDKVYEVAGFSCTKQLCGGIRTIWIDVYSPEKQRNVPLCGADSCRHHHAPTVEGTLREFMYAILNQKPEFREENIAEYAAKLRLAGDAE